MPRSERRVGRCKAARRRRPAFADASAGQPEPQRRLVEERQRSRCPRAAGTHGDLGLRSRPAAWGLQADLCIARRQRCPRIASSSRLELGLQAPCARRILLLGQAPSAARGRNQISNIGDGRELSALSIQRSATEHKHCDFSHFI
jgi:hypothetical protein